MSFDPRASRSPAAAISALALLFLVAVWASRAPLAKDDFGYLMWGQLTRADPFAWIAGPDWLSYHRPLNALVWWLSAQSGIGGAAARWTLVALWVGIGVALCKVARRSGVSLGVAVLVLLCNPVFVDLLQWRSWLTTAGSLMPMILAVAAMQRGVAPGWVLALGLLALGFKEMGALVIALIALTDSRYRPAGALLVGLLGLSAWGSAGKLSLDCFPRNLRFHFDTLDLFVAVLPTLLHARFRRLPHWGTVALLPLLLAPSWAVAAVLLAAAAALLVGSPLGLATLVSLAVPLFGAAQARQYLLEAWALVVVAALQRPRLSLPTTAWVVTLLLAAPSTIDFVQAGYRASLVWDEQRGFLAHFQPKPAAMLYHPDAAWSWNLDALYWVRNGASLGGVPPANTEPVQVGPLSGVWADVRPIQGSGSR